VERRLAIARAERERVYEALQRVDPIEVFPSVTNFILIRVRDGDSAEAHGRFLAQSVLVRDVSSWPGCEGCLRISIGTPAENDRVIAALETVFAAPGRR